LSPDHPFRTSRHDLSSLANATQSRTDVDYGAVETSTTPLDQASHDKDAGVSGNSLEELPGTISSVLLAFTDFQISVNPLIAGTTGSVTQVYTVTEVVEELVPASC